MIYHSSVSSTASKQLSTSAHINNSNILSGKLPVMEMFYTVQGEGYHTGTPACFIRLAGCDVGCVWCDVRESWKAEEHQYIPVSAIIEEACRYPARIAVITGGEPAMYNLEELINGLHQQGFRVHIETSGAYPLTGNADWICVSPKKFKEPLEQLLAVADELKVVVFNNSDFAWAAENAAFVKPSCILFLQPEYDRSSRVLPDIVAYVKLHPQWRISLQTHKFIGIP